MRLVVDRLLSYKTRGYAQDAVMLRSMDMLRLAIRLENIRVADVVDDIDERIVQVIAVLR